jgi:hypothetical protein
VRRSARLQISCFCWVLAGTFLEARTGERALFIALSPQKGQMVRRMKTTCLVCFFFFSSMAEASIRIPSIASMGADADTEAVVLGAVEPASRLMIDFTVTNPNSSNAVLLAFGKDQNADGELSAEEIKYQIGWDAGAWVEYSSNSVDSVPLQSGVSNNRLTKYMPSGEWDTMTLIVRGSVAGKVFAGKAPTIILLR